ncbi:MAG: serine hydrolase [Candidatus Saganbacteria bacterium]|nr:serine hydrolase [Candidatus Saganbacteria bacterium]
MAKYAIAALTIFICLVAGCANRTQTGLDNPDLDNMVKTQWANYASSKPTWEGEVSIYITTPKGNYFSASNLGSGAGSKVHFRGASTTKTFTAASIMLLQQQGKLNIDDKITDLIPGSSEPYVPNTANYAIPYKDKITIRMILKHRAGIWDISNSDIPATSEVPYAGQNYVSYIERSDCVHTFTFDELVGVVAINKLSYFVPDSAYHYSDTGYSILGKIIERVSGQSYDQFIRKNFLETNGLNETYFPKLGNQTTLPEPFARGYSYGGGIVLETTEDNMSPHVAEGNVISTDADLAVWIRRLMRGEAGLKASTVQMMTEGTKGKKYGLGISYVPGLGYGHDGGHAGYATVVKYDPVQDVTVVMSASVINFGDLVPYYDFLHDLGRKAKNILGYSTAEASPL